MFRGFAGDQWSPLRVKVRSRDKDGARHFGGSSPKIKDFPPNWFLGEAVLVFFVLWRTVFSKKLRFFRPKLLTISLLGCIIGSSLVNSVNLLRKRASTVHRRCGARERNGRREWQKTHAEIAQGKVRRRQTHEAHPKRAVRMAAQRPCQSYARGGFLQLKHAAAGQGFLSQYHSL